MSKEAGASNYFNFLDTLFAQQDEEKALRQEAAIPEEIPVQEEVVEKKEEEKPENTCTHDKVLGSPAHSGLCVECG
jgi:hypothetical protein